MTEHAVVIAGGGPTGLMLAGELALAKVDVAVVNAIKAAMAGTFAAGANVTNDIANGGIGYGKIGPAGLKFSSQIATIYSEIKSGKIANIPNTVP